MSEIPLRHIDLNLLVVLDVLLRERSVTRAAQRLNVTPSAISHALRRLRELFDDELLIRDGRRMRPTVRAEALAETLPRLLGQLSNMVAAPQPFEPGTSTRTFRLAAPDFIAPLVPLLLQHVGEEAPQVRIELVPFSPMVARELAEGRHDALVGPSFLGDEGVRSVALGAWPWAVFGRADHPAFRDWSLEAWSAYPHLQIRTSGGGGPGPVGRKASTFGVQRRIGAVIPHFSMAAPVLAQTNLLLTVPSLAMNSAEAAYGLVRRDVPFDLPPMGLSLFRSAAGGDEPGVRWFLEKIQSAIEHMS